MYICIYKMCIIFILYICPYSTLLNIYIGSVEAVATGTEDPSNLGTQCPQLP